jgi:hypothetical protein
MRRCINVSLELLEIKKEKTLSSKIVE